MVVPLAEQFDVVVIGGGPGGYAAALYGAAAGLKVAVVEKDKLGGTCLNRGCIPAKEYLETAQVYRTVAHSASFGISAGEPTIDFGVAQARKQKVVDQLVGGLSGLLKKRKVTVVKGFGRLSSGRTVKVDDGTELKAAHVVLAAGSVPRTLPGFDVDGTHVHTSDEVLSWTELPRRVAVVGGGVIGCEFASALCDLGCEVTILEFLPTLMPPVDTDIRAVLEKAFKKRGITVHTGAKVEGHEPQDDGSTVIRWNGDQALAVDAIVMSVGRRPYPDGLLDDGAGVEVDDKGFVKVDGTMRTSAEAVWAVGDLVNTPSWPTWRSPRPSRPSGTCWASRRCRSTTRRCRGASTATPRRRTPASPRRRRKRRATTSSSRSSAWWATGGPSSWARPTAW